MKKYLSLALLVLCLGTLASCSADQQATAVENYTAADPFQIPCGANYTRISPHQCLGTLATTVPLIKNTPCSSFTVSTSFSGIPSTAKVIQLEVDTTITGNNILNFLDGTNIIFFTASGCATAQTPVFFFEVKELVANLNTELARMVQIIPVQISSNTVFYTYNSTGGSNSSALVFAPGYYD